MKRRIAVLIGIFLLFSAQATAQEQARIRIYRTQTYIADLMRFEISLNNSITFQPAINTRINPDTQVTEKKENYAPTLTIWCVNLGLKGIL